MRSLGILLALLVAVPGAAWAQARTSETPDRRAAPLTMPVIVFGPASPTVLDSDYRARKDVREVSLPPLPDGPATPPPYCAPWQPLC